MSPYEQRLETDIKEIEDALATIQNFVVTACKSALDALMLANTKKAYEIMLGDRKINYLVKDLEDRCYNFIIKHLPTAGHLRFVSAIMNQNTELERIGDYAVTICRESVQLSQRPEGTLLEDIKHIAYEAYLALEESIAAFNHKDEKKAKATIRLAKQVERSFDGIYENLLQAKHYQNKDLLAILVIFNMFLRISNRTHNICEHTAFMVSGESKPARLYKILFLDEDNSSLSQMAEAIARKNFPNLGVYASAGRAACDALDPELLSFLEDKGIDIKSLKPKKLDSLTPGDYYLLVSLAGDIKSYLPKIPFHSIALDYDVGQSLHQIPSDQKPQHLEKLYRNISVGVHDLMQQLCPGEVK